jgi:hypothetical protein
LHALAKALKKQSIEEREKEDNQTWDQLDRLRDKNKIELAKIIEAGM